MQSPSLISPSPRPLSKDERLANSKWCRGITRTKKKRLSKKLLKKRILESCSNWMLWILSRQVWIWCIILWRLKKKMYPSCDNWIVNVVKNIASIWIWWEWLWWLKKWPGAPLCGNWIANAVNTIASSWNLNLESMIKIVD